jgi:hypothetical protein
MNIELFHLQNNQLKILKFKINKIKKNNNIK